MKLLIATNNPGKMKEIQALLEGLGLDLVTPNRIGLDLNVSETGASFAENAALKGRAFSNASGLLTLADDSGLEVDALDGLPGLYSARFAGIPAATDADRRRKLLDRLAGRAHPWTARFRCVAALVEPDGDVHFTEGICEGEIIPEQRGENGFGYDPIFWLPELGKTMAELDMAQKNQLSHRARAVRAIIPRLQEHLSKC